MTRTFALPSAPFSATVAVPGDKSLSHRALIMAAIAQGHSTVRGAAPGADLESTRAVLRSLGIDIEGDSVISAGRPSWRQPEEPLDCGNSGTTMRLMAGALAGSELTATLVGDRSLMNRPMARLVTPLAELGAEVEVDEDGTPPVKVTGGALRGSTVTLPLASAQVRTAVALAALAAEGPTEIDSPPGFRDHTERWLVALGLARRQSDTALEVQPGELEPLVVDVPGDPSSAAFLWAAAAIRPGAKITTPSVSLNPGRIGFVRILEAMGADVTVVERGNVLGDPVGDVSVRGRTLRGVTVSDELSVQALDELPLVALLAAAATGTTEVRDAEELRHKESDRIESSASLARTLGADVTTTDGGFVVESGGPPTAATIDAVGDHRIAMASAVAALMVDQVTVEGFDVAAVSWPDFGEVMEGLWS